MSRDSKGEKLAKQPLAAPMDKKAGASTASKNLPPSRKPSEELSQPPKKTLFQKIANLSKNQKILLLVATLLIGLLAGLLAGLAFGLAPGFAVLIGVGAIFALPLLLGILGSAIGKFVKENPVLTAGLVGIVALLTITLLLGPALAGLVGMMAAFVVGVAVLALLLAIGRFFKKDGKPMPLSEKIIYALCLGAILALGLTLFAPFLAAFLFPGLAAGVAVVLMGGLAAIAPLVLFAMFSNSRAFLGLGGAGLLVTAFLLPLLVPTFLAGLSFTLFGLSLSFAVALPVIMGIIGFFALAGAIISSIRNKGLQSGPKRAAILLGVFVLLAATVMFLGPLLGFGGLFFAGTAGLAVLAGIVALAPFVLVLGWRAIAAFMKYAAKNPYSAAMAIGMTILVVTGVLALLAAFSVIAAPALFAVLLPVLFVLGAVLSLPYLLSSLFGDKPPWKERTPVQKFMILMALGFVLSVSMLLFVGPLVAALCLFAPLVLYGLGYFAIKAVTALREWVKKHPQLAPALLGITFIVSSALALALLSGALLSILLPFLLITMGVGIVLVIASAARKTWEMLQKNAVYITAFLTAVGISLALIFLPLGLVVALALPGMLLIGGLLLLVRLAENPPRPLTLREKIILLLCGGLLAGVLAAFLIPLIVGTLGLAAVGTTALIFMSAGFALLPLAIYGIYKVVHAVTEKIRAFGRFVQRNAIYIFGIIAALGIGATILLLPTISAAMVGAGLAFAVPLLLPLVAMGALLLIGLGWLIRHGSGKPLSAKEKIFLSLAVAIVIGVVAALTGGLLLGLILGPVALALCGLYAIRKTLAKYPVLSGLVMGAIAFAAIVLFAPLAFPLLIMALVASLAIPLLLGALFKYRAKIPAALNFMARNAISISLALGVITCAVLLLVLPLTLPLMAVALVIMSFAAIIGLAIFGGTSTKPLSNAQKATLSGVFIAVFSAAALLLFPIAIPLLIIAIVAASIIGLSLLVGLFFKIQEMFSASPKEAPQKTSEMELTSEAGLSTENQNTLDAENQNQQGLTSTTSDPEPTVAQMPDSTAASEGSLPLNPNAEGVPESSPGLAEASSEVMTQQDAQPAMAQGEGGVAGVAYDGGVESVAPAASGGGESTSEGVSTSDASTEDQPDPPADTRAEGEPPEGDKQAGELEDVQPGMPHGGAEVAGAAADEDVQSTLPSAPGGPSSQESKDEAAPVEDDREEGEEDEIDEQEKAEVAEKDQVEGELDAPADARAEGETPEGVTPEPSSTASSAAIEKSPPPLAGEPGEVEPGEAGEAQPGEPVENQPGEAAVSDALTESSPPDYAASAAASVEAAAPPPAYTSGDTETSDALNEPPAGEPLSNELPNEPPPGYSSDEQEGVKNETGNETESGANVAAPSAADQTEGANSTPVPRPEGALDQQSEATKRSEPFVSPVASSDAAKTADQEKKAQEDALQGWVKSVGRSSRPETAEELRARLDPAVDLWEAGKETRARDDQLRNMGQIPGGQAVQWTAQGDVNLASFAAPPANSGATHGSDANFGALPVSPGVCAVCGWQKGGCEHQAERKAQQREEEVAQIAQAAAAATAPGATPAPPAA